MALTVVRGLLARGDTDNTLDEERAILAEIGAEVEAIPIADRERLLAALPRADGLFGVSFIDGDMIEMLQRCRGIILIAHGFNHVDLNAATEAGIPVSNLFFCH